MPNSRRNATPTLVPRANELKSAPAFASTRHDAGPARGSVVPNLEELRRSEQNLRTIIENTPSCIKVVAADGTIVSMNRAGVDIVEAESSAAVVGQCVFDLIAPEYREAFREMHRKVCAGEKCELQYEIVGLKGRRRWMHTHAAPTPHPQTGEPAHLAITRDITEQKQAELTIRLNEERLRFATLSDAITLYEQDAQLRYTWLYPLKPHYVNSLGKSDYQLLPNEEGAFLERVKSEVMRTGQSQRHIVSATFPDRKTCYDLIISPRRDSAGNVIGVGGSALDITDRKAAEEALRISELRWRSVTETLPNLVWTDLPDGQCDWLSSQWGKYTGIPENELLGLVWLDRVIHPEDRERTIQCWQKACADEGIYDLEYRIRRHDGQYRWFKTRGVPVRDANGKIVYWFGTCTDIQDIKEAEEKLAFVAALVEHSDDAIFSADPDGIILSWNRGAERLYGYLAEETIGRSLSLLTPEGHGDESGVLERVRQGQAVANHETLRRRKDGSVFHASLTISPVKDAQGRIIGMSKVARDITEKVRAREILEQIVAERTASLEQALAQMEEFTYSVSHDLRAPARSVYGYAQAAIEDYGATMPPELRQFVDHIATSAHRMEDLIRDILDYSRVARSDAKLAPVDLDELIPVLINDIPAVQSTGAQITLRSPLGAVLAHRPSLLQAITNLLANAVKFVAPGTTPRIQLWTVPANGFVRLWVSDNGIGIPPKYHYLLFKVFERIHDGTRYEGTGVGLAIVRKAVERMGGQVGVESDGISGSKFWIELPAVPAV